MEDGTMSRALTLTHACPIAGHGADQVLANLQDALERKPLAILDRASWDQAAELHALRIRLTAVMNGRDRLRENLCVAAERSPNSEHLLQCVKEHANGHKCPDAKSEHNNNAGSQLKLSRECQIFGRARNGSVEDRVQVNPENERADRPERRQQFHTNHSICDDVDATLACQHPDPNSFHSVPVIAKQFGVSANTVRRAAADGRLAARQRPTPMGRPEVRLADARIFFSERSAHQERTAEARAFEARLNDIEAEHPFLVQIEHQLSSMYRSSMSTILRMTTACLVTGLSFPAFAQVPTNDAERTGKETNTRVCMERARTYKQRTEAPTNGVRGSFADQGGGGSLSQSGSTNITGGAASGTTVGGVDLAGIMAGVAALKSNNAGQVAGALSAVSAAIEQNRQGLVSQGQAIGSVNSIQGALDQNSSGRLSEASLWGQAVQSGTTRLQLQNQQLLDQAAAASATANIMDYDKSKVRLIDDDKVRPDNAENVQADTTNLEAIRKELERRQREAEENALKTNNPTTTEGN
jgi:hypothetical protein